MNSYSDYLAAYKLLGLEVGVSTNEIKYAYRKLAREIHPDKNRFKDSRVAHENFTRLLNAYILLCDEAERRRFENDFKFKNNTWKVIVRGECNEFDKQKIQYKRRMCEKAEKRKEDDTVEKLLCKLRKESLPLLDLYRTYLERCEMKRQHRGLDSILQRLLKGKTINNIIGEFEQFERAVLSKLKRLES
ncbi:DNAJ protein [Cryptosporidium bovis]|uniref:DNAJ protein n=1 Tax=Cryptosporidium bovis TaxID=310047 RepID=UPI003519E6D3|nr:DNAJ protein [Cryptosporidium bovis]